MTSAAKSCEEVALKACPYCARTFTPNALLKHAAICEKVLRKRKVFDSSQQRRVGNVFFNCVPFEREVRLDVGRPGKLAQLKPKTLASAGPKKRTPTGNHSLERCPHCERSFNQKAFANHVAWCKENTVLASFSVGLVNDEALEAKKRFEARVNYKPPTPKRNKRVSYLIGNQ